jgi:hypothetical protein
MIRHIVLNYCFGCYSSSKFVRNDTFWMLVLFPSSREQDKKESPLFEVPWSNHGQQQSIEVKQLKLFTTGAGR